jgi:integrase
MRGSAVYQVQTLWAQSGINRIGTAKHCAKQVAREAGARTWGDLGRELGIHSYGTADAYREVWVAVMRHARVHFSVRDIECLQDEIIGSFLAGKIEEEIALATYKQYAAACGKLESALNLYHQQRSPEVSKEKKYDFREAIDATREIARVELRRFEASRAYDYPVALIAALDNPHFQLAARLQLLGGPRVREVSLIKADQCRGRWPDPLTNGNKGWFAVEGKGGKRTTVGIPSRLYDALLQEIELHGAFRICADRYRRALQRAAAESGQDYQGSHGLRWNYARNRLNELQRHGLVFEEAMQQVSRELGHERATITLHYCQ